jgi:hypothetical protein
MIRRILERREQVGLGKVLCIDGGHPRHCFSCYWRMGMVEDIQRMGPAPGIYCIARRFEVDNTLYTSTLLTQFLLYTFARICSPIVHLLGQGCVSSRLETCRSEIMMETKNDRFAYYETPLGRVSNSRQPDETAARRNS